MKSSISVIETGASNQDSTSYSQALDTRWLTRWIAVGLVSMPLSSSVINDKAMLSLVIEGDHPDTVYGSHVDETIGDEMLLHEMERIANQLSHIRPQFSDATLRALYDKPEQLYL